MTELQTHYNDYRPMCDGRNIKDLVFGVAIFVIAVKIK